LHERHGDVKRGRETHRHDYTRPPPSLGDELGGLSTSLGLSASPLLILWTESVVVMEWKGMSTSTAASPEGLPHHTARGHNKLCCVFQHGCVLSPRARWGDGTLTDRLRSTALPSEQCAARQPQALVSPGCTAPVRAVTPLEAGPEAMDPIANRLNSLNMWSNRLNRQRGASAPSLGRPPSTKLSQTYTVSGGKGMLVDPPPPRPSWRGGASEPNAASVPTLRLGADRGSRGPLA